MHSLVVPEHEPVFDICEVHVTPKYKIDLRKNVKCNKSFKSKATIPIVKWGTNAFIRQLFSCITD